jgi:hypothetical protein
MNIASMARKLLALLLLVFWISFSGMDALEDLDLPDQVKLYNSTASPLLDPGHNVRLAHNMVESAGQSRIRYPCFWEQSGKLLTTAPTLSRKTPKLHKLHRVYLI